MVTFKVCISLIGNMSYILTVSKHILHISPHGSLFVIMLLLNIFAEWINISVLRCQFFFIPARPQYFPLNVEY